ncbi:apoptosis-stimulating of p53 protein 2 isoform X2 [Onthophagus taurus]|uniref:apoptosis-stimulating of p53 protein 2 isoform X2 n=1 Tax=Onthophagus taurus TaxID=166361 RepID=UPI0039BEAFD7
MLACVCQPSDPGIFRRSPVPLGSQPLRLDHNGAIPKPPGRILCIPVVVTNEPSPSREFKRHGEKRRCNILVNKCVEKDFEKEDVNVNIQDVSAQKKQSKENINADLGTLKSGLDKLPDGVQLTLTELREMACRQQAQIDSQHQLLAAKEQRLRYLKEQEARQQRVQAESERLRRLRDRVDAQELKLRKLRAIRGQVDHQKQNNLSLTSDLDSIRALFNEKEKELSLAVAKVEELTRQLEELRRGRSSRDQPPASALELDKLRRELMYRNKLNEQQNQRLNQQREALTARQEEMSAIDKRISELQERLHRKRLLNQQLANQISATSHKAAYHQLVRLTGNDQNSPPYPRKPQHPTGHPPNGLNRTNIAAVEPYNHVPLQQSQQSRNNVRTGSVDNTNYHPAYQQQTNHIKADVEHQHFTENHHDSNPNKLNKQEDSDLLKDFAVSKSDPKYQTLPYNTKFTVNIVPNRAGGVKQEGTEILNQNEADVKNDGVQTQLVNGNLQSPFAVTVHSAPLNILNKSIATPVSQTDLINRKNGEKDGFERNQLTNTSVNNSLVPSYQKPISSVAPTSVHNNGKLSNIYQTSSIKVQPVEPQTLSGNHKQISSPPVNTFSQSLALSPPQSTSTPNSTPEINVDKSKPALPPKPAIKPPPRQTQLSNDENLQPPPLPISDPPDDKQNLGQKPKFNTPTVSNQMNQLQKSFSSSVLMNYSGNNDNMPIIKAKPLTIKKQALTEQPKLRTVNSYNKLNGINLNTRRIEIPPSFNYDPQIIQDNQNHQKSENLENHPSEIIKDKLPTDETDKSSIEDNEIKDIKDTKPIIEGVVRRCKKGNLKQTAKPNLSRRVSFDPLALLLDASLEGELELVKKTASQVTNPSAANDEGITALHNAICAGHLEIVMFLVEFGCDVNAQDSDGWTPLHCAASCNNVAMVKFLVEHGACIFATTLSDHETAAEKCEEDEEGFDGCSEYLYSVQEKLGILSGGIVYAVFDYMAQQPDELSFTAGQQLTVLRKGDESEREWWWSRLGDKEGYIPRNLLGLYPRVSKTED